MSRVFDRGAITAAFVGIGVAVTMAMSFLLIIPIEPAYLLLSIPAGLVIGYYANARSRRIRGQWRRIVPNALLAGLVTGASLAVMLLGTKALFFYADNGYPDFNRTENGVAVGPTCVNGADCVYRRYLAADAAQLQASGVTDSVSFATAYWNAQASSARLLVGGTTVAALFGGLLFGVGGPRTAATVPVRRAPVTA